MKKKKVSLVMVAAIAVAAGWGIYLNEKEVNLSDLVLANVEAIANGETPGILCNRYPEGEGRCWTIDWASPIIAMHCIFSGNANDRCVELP